MLGPALLPEAALSELRDTRCISNGAKPRLHAVPERLVDDAQGGDLLDDPGGRRIEARDAFAGLRVFDVAEPVPDQSADIELVPEDARAAQAVAANGGVDPGATVWTSYPFGIECAGDRPRAGAGGERG